MEVLTYKTTFDLKSGEVAPHPPRPSRLGIGEEAVVLVKPTQVGRCQPWEFHSIFLLMHILSVFLLFTDEKIKKY